MAVTIKDIAKIAGVTHSTVSRCLNDRPGVSDSVRAEIKKIAADLNFEFNANARGLNTSRTGTIGIILDEDPGSGKLHLFTNSFLSQIRTSLEREDLDILTSFARNSCSRKDNIQKLINRRKIDGLILLTTTLAPETVDSLKKSGIPFVFSHQIPSRSYGQVNAVSCDHERGGYKAVQHLIERGRRRILCMRREDEREEFTLRTVGYRRALEESGLEYDPALVIPGGYSLNCARETLDRMESALSSADALFAHTDLIALGLLKELLKRGVKIPEDIALVGYDNIGLCTYAEPNLTSVDQCAEEISVQTCRNLIRQLGGDKSSEHTIIEPKLIIRDST